MTIKETFNIYIPIFVLSVLLLLVGISGLGILGLLVSTIGFLYQIRYRARRQRATNRPITHMVKLSGELQPIDQYIDTFEEQWKQHNDKK